MKNAINYYYNFNIDYLHFYHQKHFFKFLYNDYVLIPYNRSEEEVMPLYELNSEVLRLDSNYHRIILNKDKNPVTIIDNNPYILLQIRNIKNRELDLDDIYSLPISQKAKNVLNRFVWAYLWAKKIDYIEYQIEHFEMEFPILTENIWYFIGLGENAISYVQDTLREEIPTEQDKLVISHRRVTANYTLFDYYNPLTLIIDHQTRDIAEFLKSYFWSGKYDMQKIEDYFERTSFSNYGYRLLLGRLLFPSFYFDVYEKVIDHQMDEKEIVLINGRIKEYEEYINNIYFLLRRYATLPNIEWINKKT